MADEEPTRPDHIEIPLVWEAPDDLPTAFANQFLIQHQPGEFILTVGLLVTPPITTQDEDQRRAAIERIPYVPIKMLGRFGFSRERMVELISVLQENLRKHDDKFGPEGSPKGTGK